MRPLLFLMFIVAGCATLKPVGQFKLEEESWTKAQADITSRASFELKCPPDKLTLTVLSVFPGNDHYANQVGVTGCDRQLVYTMIGYGTWALNSSDADRK